MTEKKKSSMGSLGAGFGLLAVSMVVGGEPFRNLLTSNNNVDTPGLVVGGVGFLIGLVVITIALVQKKRGV